MLLLHLPIVIMATLSPVAVSDTVPKFDIARECHFEGGSITEFGRCSEDERTALRDLQQGWPQFGGADKRSCTVEATTSGFASYVELLTCLEMARDAAGPNTNPNEPHMNSRTRPTQSRETGVTVGEGR
jgi:hypothetical protein